MINTILRLYCIITHICTNTIFFTLQMRTIKDILNFCNAAILYDYKNEGITEELNQVRKYIIISFYKTIHNTTLLTSLSIIDDIILKINDNDIENIIDNIHDLREYIIYAFI